MLREREREIFSLKDHRHQSARARCCTVDHVLHVNYSGAINPVGFQELSSKIVSCRLASVVAYELMDKALTLSGSVVVDELAWPVGTPPSAVVVRQDQFEQAMAVSRALAARGIIRFVFLSAEIRMAQAFVERVREYQFH